METQFEKVKNLVNEYDELQRFVKELENQSNNIGVIHTHSDYYDSPGVNYSTYSNKCKQSVISALKNRMAEISKQFN